MKWNTFLLFTFLLICLPSSFADQRGGGLPSDDSNDDSFTDDQKDQLNEQGIDPSSTSPDQVTFHEGGSLTVNKGPFSKGGVTYNGKNIVVDENGNIPEADSLEVDGNNFEKVQNFQRVGGGEYQMDEADYLDDGKRKVVKGRFITGRTEDMQAQEAETIVEEAISSGVQEYSSADDEFSVAGAKAVVLDDTIFTDIKDSSFKTDNDELVEAEITSASDNNSFSFKDIDVSFDKDDTVQLKKNKTSGKYDVSVDSENGTVEDYEGNVACADVSPGSRYRYQDGESNEHFGLYVPSSATNFKLCIKTEEAESYNSNCSQCGVVDFINNTAELNGQYEFEKHDLDPRLFTNVIDGGLRFPP